MDFSFSSWSPKTFPPTVAVTFINNLVCDVVHASSAALPLQRCNFDYTAFSIVVQIGNTPMEKLFSL